MKFGLASRNLYHVASLPERKSNVYDIVHREKLVITSEALKNLQERLISRRQHLGKRKALLDGLRSMTELRTMHEEKLASEKAYLEKISVGNEKISS